MSSRPDIELALDVRSDENVVVVSNAESTYDYPPHWRRPLTFGELAAVLNGTSIVVIDRVEVTPNTLALIASYSPRLVAFATQPKLVEYEKSARRMITGMFPWNEVWTVSTSFGKLLVTPSIKGLPYERDAVLDARPVTAA